MKNTELKLTKRLTLTVLTVVIFGAGAFVTNARAQTSETFEIQIPFDFVVKNRIYEAGTYHIGRFNAANPDTLILKNGDGKKSLILLTQRHGAGAPLKFSKLTFSRYGEKYFLDTIRSSGENYESRIPSNKSNPRRGSREQIAEIISITQK